MRTLRAAFALLFLVVLWSVPLGAQTEGVEEVVAAPTSPEVSAVPSLGADAPLLDDLYRRHHISSQTPEPGFGQYVQDVGKTLGRTLNDWLSTHIGGLAGSTSQLLMYVGYGLLGTLTAVCLWLAVRYLMQRFQQSSAPSTGAGTVRSLGTEAVAPTAAGSWESVLRQALTDGDVGRAVHALWWWLAQSLGCGADPSWTSRELVQRSGRRDLRPHVRRLDRLLYSPRAPRLDDVETLWRELRPLVGAAVATPEEGTQ